VDHKISTSNDSSLFHEPYFENHNDAICILNLEGNFLYANQALSTLLGYSSQELLGLSFQKIVSSEDLEIFNYYFQKAAISDTQEFIAVVNCKNGNQTEFKIITVSNEIEGKVDNIFCFFTEANEQPLVHAGVYQTSKDLSDSFVENNRDPILILDMDAIIVLANRAFSKLLGWRKENLEGFHILNCPSIPPNLIEQMRDYYNRVVNGEPDLTALKTIRITNKGKEYNMLLTITPMNDQDGIIRNWAIQLRDITKHKILKKATRTDKIIKQLDKK
jgi:PAS domain S-box-containing protein